jgi:hypothetical protein
MMPQGPEPRPQRAPVARPRRFGYDPGVPLSPWILALTGAATGLLGALLGLGGGVLLVPLLTIGLGVPIRTAIAASLLSVIASASASATVNLSRGLVNLRLGLVLEMATAIGGLGGGLLSQVLTTRQLFVLFAITMAAMGLVMLARSKRRNVLPDTGAEPGALGGRIQEGETSYLYRVKRLPLALTASLGAGAISGLLGLGGGIIKVPVLSTFCGIPIKVAAATSTFMIGVTAAASAFVYYSRGDVDLPLASAVCLGALPASLLGAQLSRRVEARALKILMAVVLLGVGARMALEGR